MPSQVLHTLFGEDVIAGLHSRIAGNFGAVAGKALEKIKFAYRTAFSLGCQGPDVFYHNRRTRPVGLEYGSLLHRRGAGIFTAGLLKMGLPDPPPDEEDIKAGRREKGINALGVYTLGFMTHALLDRAAHPYIVYKSALVSPGKGEIGQYAIYHLFFERILDALMLKELRGEDIAAWDQDKILVEACENPPLGLRELLARALVLAFPERAGKDEKLALRIENTFCDCAKFYHWTAPGFTSMNNTHFQEDLFAESIPYLFPENISNGDGGIDFLNLKKRPWQYPLAGREEDFRSFTEIYSDAVKAAVDSIGPVMTSYLETGIFPIPEAAKVIGNGGLSIVDENGKPCSPTMTDPLPLGDTLKAQAKMRGL